MKNLRKNARIEASGCAARGSRGHEVVLQPVQLLEPQVGGAQSGVAASSSSGLLLQAPGCRRVSGMPRRGMFNTSSIPRASSSVTAGTITRAARPRRWPRRAGLARSGRSGRPPAGSRGPPHRGNARSPRSAAGTLGPEEALGERHSARQSLRYEPRQIGSPAGRPCLKASTVRAAPGPPPPRWERRDETVRNDRILAVRLQKAQVGNLVPAREPKEGLGLEQTMPKGPEVDESGRGGHPDLGEGGSSKGVPWILSPGSPR